MFNDTKTMMQYIDEAHQHERHKKALLQKKIRSIKKTLEAGEIIPDYYAALLIESGALNEEDQDEILA